MKTININLIGELRKNLKTNNKNAKISSLDAKNQILAYILIIGIMIIFAACAGGWLLVRTMSSNLDKKLIRLNNNLDLLREEESQLSAFKKSLNKEKEITRYKIVIQKQLNAAFFPWSTVLQKIASKIPRDIVVQKIEKSNETGKSKNQINSLKLNISGIISTDRKPNPIVAVSLFIFNLNENPNSLLSNAKITKLEFNDKTRAYEFKIETSVNPINNMVSITSTPSLTENKSTKNNSSAQKL